MAKPRGMPPTTPRAWRSLTLGFGLVNVDVGIGPLFDDNGISGRQLCPDHLEPVSQRWHCENGDGHLIHRVLDGGEDSYSPVSGFEWDGEFVVLTDDEKERLRTAIDKRVEITQAVPVDEIDPIFYKDNPYLVWPVKDNEQAFDVLAEVMRSSGVALVGTACLTTRTRQLVLRWSPALETPVMHVCHFEDDLRWRNIEMVTGSTAARTPPSKQHLSAARPLVAALKGHFDASGVVDTYRKSLEMVIAARKGKKVRMPKKVAPKPQKDLLDSLRASVKESQKRREKV